MQNDTTSPCMILVPICRNTLPIDLAEKLLQSSHEKEFELLEATLFTVSLESRDHVRFGG